MNDAAPVLDLGGHRPLLRTGSRGPKRCLLIPPSVPGEAVAAGDGRENGRCDDG